MRSLGNGVARYNVLNSCLVTQIRLGPQYLPAFSSRLGPSVSNSTNLKARSPIAAYEYGRCSRKYTSLRIHDTHEPTIYALSTAPGRAAIAIIRLSGSACLSVYRALCPGEALPKPRYATLRTLCEPTEGSQGGQILDAGALVFYFPAPFTVTGEDVLEFHVHGGTAVVKAVLAAVPKTPPGNDQSQEIRYAEPGEFTKRAFYNNRLDLTQVEALGDTLSAETEQQRRLAIQGSTSSLADRYDEWRQKLLDARGELEALIDFSEDQHFDESPAKLCASVTQQVRNLQLRLRASIESASRGELLRNGINIALVGAPNAGKSSLLNRIVGREAAIVSEQAGTTRDVVDVSVDIGGYLCRFSDLAGLRGRDENPCEVNDIEEEGMRRAKERALKADVVIVLLSIRESVGRPLTADDVSLGAEVEDTLEKLNAKSQKVVFVINKADLFSDLEIINQVSLRFGKHPTFNRFAKASGLPLITVSCIATVSRSTDTITHYGVQPLLKGLTYLFSTMTDAVVPGISANDSAWAASLGATERQRILLQECLQHLDSFVADVSTTGTAGSAAMLSSQEAEDIDIVLAAESLRSAATSLAKITGRGEAGDVEEVLGVVFEKFCVGK